MKYFTLYRLAAYVLLMFCAGHTAGGMLGQKSVGSAGDLVFAQMQAVHFDFNGADCTWYGFWFAFGIGSSVFLLLSAAAAWHLSSVEPTQWRVVAPIAWAFFIANFCNAVLTWKYFFPGAATFASLAAALLGAGAIRKAREARRSAAAVAGPS